MKRQLGFDFAETVISARPCTMCGEIIHTVRKGDTVESEYCDEQGRCWYCAQLKQARP